MTAGVRFADPLKKAIILERLLSAQLSVMLIEDDQPDSIPDGAEPLLLAVRKCLYLRAFMLVREFLDPKEARRYPVDVIGKRSPYYCYRREIRRWRRRFPDLELQ